MKIYEFKMLVHIFGFLMIYISVLLYALIWLNNGYKMEDAILDSEKRTHKVIIEEIQKSDFQLRNQIMPSAFKEIPQWTRQNRR